VEEQKQANKGNFRLTSVAHERQCLCSIFSMAPIKYSNASVVLFHDRETLHMCLMCLSKRMSFAIAALFWNQYLVLFYEPRKDFEALSYSDKIDKTGLYRNRYYKAHKFRHNKCYR